MTTPTLQLIGAIYVRSASGASALDTQRIQCEKYAAQDETRIVKIYSDADISGNSNPQQRPGLSAMLEYAREGVFNVLYLANLIRLGRRPEHLLDIVSQLRAAGVKIKIGEKGELIVNEELFEFVKNITQVMLREAL